MTTLLSWATALMFLLVGNARLLADDAKEGGELLKETGELKNDDGLDKVLKKSFFKAHPFKMKAGQAYKIELNSKDFDTLLRLENEEGRQVAFNDDISPQNLNSRVVYLAPKDGTYRIIVTSFKPGDTGKYALTVVPANKQEVLEARVESIGGLPPGEQAEVLAEFRKHLDAKGPDLSGRDVNLALNLAMALDQRQSPAAPETYRDFAKRFAASKEKRVADLAATLQGAARRTELPGKEMDIKGTLLDGKKIDWSSYKGKVVLVDFWATWCGPCLAELPNMKKMYEAYHDRGFDIVGISLDFKEESLTKFMEKEKLPWVCIYEKGTQQQPMAEYYGIFSIPQAILVDREGRVVSMNARGPQLEHQLAKIIGPLDGKKK